MKKLSLLLLLFLLVPSVMAGVGIEGPGIDFSSGSVASTERSGVRFIVNNNISLVNVTRFSGVNGTVVSLFNDSRTLLNFSFFSGNVANLSYNLVAGTRYILDVNTTTGSGWMQYCSILAGALPLPISGLNLNWLNGSFNGAFQDGTYFCNIASVTYRDTNPSSVHSAYNASTYKTSLESYTSNFSMSNISSATFTFVNMTYSATVTSLGTDLYQLYRSFDIPSDSPGGYWYWNLTFVNGSNVRTSPLAQATFPINLTACSVAPQNVVYINVTFKNETAAQNKINASAVSTWNYYLGSGTVSQTLSYTNASLNPFYAFCFSPSHRTIYTNVTIAYANTESQSRTYTSSLLTLTNTTTNTVLYLLPTSLGQFVTFQIVNPAQQAIAGATVVASSSTFGTVESHTTDGSGGATFFLNPLTTYTINVSAAGYDPVSTTITPSQTSYTIQLGAIQNNTQNDYTRGVTLIVAPPTGTTLYNSTTYPFNLTIGSSFWSLQSYGFFLGNGTATFASASGSSSTGSTVGVNLNTGNNQTLVMRYFYTINGTTSNFTLSWSVTNTALSQYSITRVLSDFVSYVSLGLFGADTFSVGLIFFFVIFFATGLFSYNYGFNTPAAILGFATAAVALFDVGFNVIPNPVGAVGHFPTVFMMIMMIGFMLKEATQ